MPTDKRGIERSPLGRWFHDTFDDWLFRSFIGPAQTRNAVQGCDESARLQWKHDLENRKRYSRELREAREAGRSR